jgi:tRNA(adenine34) deaminase
MPMETGAGTEQLPGGLSNTDLERFMREALKEAEAAGREGELPIGAVLVVHGEVVARGRSQRKGRRNQLMHAEMNALLNGGEPLWDHYEDAVLFTTLEPCPLCLGAAVMADVPHIVFASRDEVVYSRQTLDANPYVRRHIRTYHGGVLESEVHEMMARFDPHLLRKSITKPPPP